MRSRQLGLITLMTSLFLLLSLGFASPAEAQVKKLKDRAKNTVERKAGDKVEDAVEDLFDGSGNRADPGQIEPASSTAEAEPPPSADLKPGEGAWANYDFVPGERPLFVEEFDRDRVGDFPRRLEFVNGNMEVVEWQGGRYLRATASSAFAIPLPEVLPDRFTVEIEHSGNSWSWPFFTVRFDGENQDPRTNDRVIFRTYQNHSESSGGVYSLHSQQKATGVTAPLQETLFPARIMADGSYVKVYMGATRVANMPNADLGRADRIVIEWDGHPERPSLIGSIRVMAGGRELYDALEAEGRVATQGILFDSGSDRLRPESTPTLAEIGAMLRDHPELRLGIEGHTDAVGSPGTNQALSERRAAAVKAFLSESYGIDPGRLESSGFGASRPVADNESAEGRQRNRRVELVRL